MSTIQSGDDDLVEQTKQQIRGLVREIAQISKSDVAPLEFYSGILQRIVKALAAVGGAVWTVAENGQMSLEYEINLRATGMAESQEDQVRHTRLVRNVINAGEGTLVAPMSGSGRVEDGGNPTEFLLVLGPLKTANETVGVIEVFQRPGANSGAQQGYLTFLLQMCELANEYLKSRKLQHFTDRQALWAQLENFTRSVHKGLDKRATSYTIANDGRRLIECDRVSVALLNGKKCSIEAVSGQDMFDKRSNTIVSLAHLATAVVAAGEMIWYTGDTSAMPPQVEEAVQEYVDEVHSKAVIVMPLKEPHDKNDPTAQPRILGALIIEQIEDSRPREGLSQRIDIVSEHSAIALANSVEHNELFLMPVWRAIGKSRWIVQARQLPYTITIGSALLLVVLFLCLWPGDFDLSSKGVLQPAVVRNIYPHHDGEIIDVKVENRQKVKAGQPLVQMRVSELEQKYGQVAGQLGDSRGRLAAVLQQLQGPMASDRRIEAEGQRSSLSKQIESLEEQMLELNRQKANLIITSPIDGEIEGWQLKQNLEGRSVSRTQQIMSVLNPDGEWVLELKMPEDRMGFIREAEKTMKPLSVRYITTTNPNTEHKGTVIEIDESAAVRSEDGNTVLIRVAIDKNDVPDRHNGGTVTAKVHCGRAPIGYVWFHDLVAWFQKGWFKIF